MQDIILEWGWRKKTLLFEKHREKILVGISVGGKYELRIL
jgi:hypothetical protein